MIFNETYIKTVVRTLNRLLELDPDAIAALVNYGVSPNKELQKETNTNGVSVGLLCIINSFFGVNDEGDVPIEAVFVENKLSYFKDTGLRGE